MGGSWCDKSLFCWCHKSRQWHPEPNFTLYELYKVTAEWGKLEEVTLFIQISRRKIGKKTKILLKRKVGREATYPKPIETNSVVFHYWWYTNLWLYRWYQLTTPMLRKLFLLVLSIRSEKNWDMIILHWKAAFPTNVPCAECSYPWPTISYDAACKADFISAALYARSLWQYLFGFIFAVLSLWLYLSCSVIQSLYAGSFWRYLCGFIFVTLS